MPADPQARFLSGITRATITVMMKKDPRMPKSAWLLPLGAARTAQSQAHRIAMKRQMR
jgi:hypothetical protein